MTKTGRVIKEGGIQYKKFIKENKWVPWIVIASVILSYGISLTGFRIGIDAESNINDADTFLNSWYSIGRFSLVFFKNLTGLRELNPFLANMLMMVVMVFYGLFANFMFYVFSDSDKQMRVFYLIFPALFLTHPCYVQQYIFTVQAFEVAVCTLTCLLSVYLISRWAFGEGKGFLLSGIVLMVWSFGGYQAIVPLYMSAALAVYLVYYYFHDNQEPFFYLRAAVRYALSFVAGYILYSFAVRLVLIWKEGAGFQGQYLEGQIHWAQYPPEICIGGIKYYMKEVLLGTNGFYTKTFLVFLLLFALHLLYTWVKGRRGEYILYAAAAVALVLSPFYLAFYQGGGILMRSQMALPFVAAFFAAAFTAFALSNRCVPVILATAVCLYFAVNQATFSSKAIFSAQMTYEHDKMVAQQLVNRMQELDAVGEGQRIAMIGQYQPKLPQGAAIRKETIGFSFFEWDFAAFMGVTNRGTGFLKALGYPYEKATLEEFAASQIHSVTMPSWPAKDSVQRLGDVIVVKFSD